jgi:hypothetical protein
MVESRRGATGAEMAAGDKGTVKEKGADGTIGGRYRDVLVAECVHNRNLIKVVTHTFGCDCRKN